MKRILSLLLCAAMLVGMISATVITSSAWGSWTPSGSVGMYSINDVVYVDSNTGYLKATNGYATVSRNLSAYGGVMLHLSCYFGTNGGGSGNSRIAFGSGSLSCGYDFSAKCFFIGTNSSILSTSGSSVSSYVKTVPYEVPVWGATNGTVHLAFQCTQAGVAVYLNGAQVISANYSDYGLGHNTTVVFAPNNILTYYDSYWMASASTTNYALPSAYTRFNYGNDITGSNGVVNTSYSSLTNSANITWSADATNMTTNGYSNTEMLVKRLFDDQANYSSSAVTYSAARMNNINAAIIAINWAYNNDRGNWDLACAATGWHYVLNWAKARCLANQLGQELANLNASSVSHTASWKNTLNGYQARYDALASYDSGVAAAGTYDARGFVTNYSNLTAARARYNELVTAKADADAAIAKINTIGPVIYTTQCKNKIDAARAAYDDLSMDACAFVTTEQIKILEDAEKEYDRLDKEAKDSAAATAFINEVKAIGTVTLGSETAINAAYGTYAKLTADQLAYAGVSDAKATLDAAQDRLDVLKAAKVEADKVIAKIDAIGTVTLDSEAAIIAAEEAYEAVSGNSDIINFIGAQNKLKLLTARNDYDNLYNEEVKSVAEAFIKEVNEIGTVTLDSETAISDAYAAYAALTTDDQLAYDGVAEAKATLDAAKDRLDVLKAAKADADAAIAKIDAIGTVTLDSEAAIIAAEEAVAGLSTDAASFVTDAQKKIVTDARAAYTKLYNKQLFLDFVSDANNVLEEITISDKDEINALIAYYDNNLRVLEKTVHSYGATEGIPLVNNATREYNNLKTALVTIAELEAAVSDFQVNLVPTTATVAAYTMNDMANIAATLEAAEAAYEAMDDEQKALVADEYAQIAELRVVYDASLVCRVKATSLIISDSLAVNYKIELGDAYDIVRMEFVVNGDVNDTLKLTEYTMDGTRLAFRCDNISPNLIGETIASVIIVSDGNGNEIKCIAAEYAVTTYVNKQIAKSSSTEDFKSLLASLVNYGDNSVAYVNEGNTVPSSQIVNWDSYKSLVAPTREYVSIEANGDSLANPAVTFASSTLVLTDAVNVNFNLAGDIDDTYEAVLVYHDKSYKCEIQTDDGVNYYFVADIFSASQMPSKFVATIVDENGNAVSNSLTFSIESYVVGMINKYTVELDNLLISLMQYGDAARAYNASASIG